jgi:putative transposase
MAPPLRLEYPGALYHVTSRGNGRSKIFRSDKDRTAFLTILGAVIQKYTLQLRAYCLMDNHYHLVVETLDRLSVQEHEKQR